MMSLHDRFSLVARTGSVALIATALAGGLGFYAGSALEAGSLSSVAVVIGGICIGTGLVLWAVKSGPMRAMQAIGENLQAISAGRFGGSIPYATQRGELGVLAAAVEATQAGSLICR